MNQADGDDVRQTSTLNEYDTVRDVEFWDSSSSTAILLGDEIVVSSRSSRDVYNSPFPLDDTDSGILPTTDSSSTSLVALRPLHSGAHQPGYEDSLPRVPDLKLAQRSRKGHRKSRQGCFNCKRRKIKVTKTVERSDAC
jgi:hypothetical protein